MPRKRARKRTAYKRTPEGYVLLAVCDLLRAKRIWFERRNVGRMKSQTGQWCSFGIVGEADLLALPNHPGGGKYALRIECKAPGKKQTADQKMYEQVAVADNQVYLLVNNIDVLIQWLKEKGL